MLGKISKSLGLAAGLIVYSMGAANAVTIGFEDATGNGNAIGNFYSGLGVTFQNAAWYDDMTGSDPRPGLSGTYAVLSISDGGLVKAADPIVGVFNAPVDFVSLQAIDVGSNDATLAVYDATVGGNLLGTFTYEGATTLGNEGDANDTGLLQLSLSGILRFEFYQPLSVVSNDGTWFDTLTFNFEEPAPVPLPPALPLLLGALGVFGFMGWRRKAAAT